MPLALPEIEIWFVVGSQHLYGPAALEQVAANARHMVAGMNDSGVLPLRLVAKPVMTTPDDIRALCQQANADPRCGGLVLWMHTFSPAKMWIGGLRQLSKPFAHFHTQFNRDLPWSTIDMDFMNLNQAAHGDREAGFLHTRMRLERTVIVGHWQDRRALARLATWMRAVRGWAALQGAKFVRFADNMRYVAVTDGDRVAGEMRFGYSVVSHGVGELAAAAAEVSDAAIDALCREYEACYEMAPELRRGGARHGAVREQARLELALRGFLERGGFSGFTDNFEDLTGLRQLPGLATQRLMADGYGFGAEGDWKTCAMVRAMKVMGAGLPGGTSFMEDYTYHLDPERPLVLGAHMLEVCPSIAAQRPSLEVHPLGIGGKEDPARLVFTARSGPALNASLIDLGNRFRLLINEVTVVEPPAPLPKLPVARAVWAPKPDFATACAAWIYAGGAHHTAFSQAVTTEMLLDFASIAGIEAVPIDGRTELPRLLNDLRFGEVYWGLGSAFARV
ncbi:MAG: L-arabinose isomerase [Planctomycetota bacterium]|nr:L-arabinose isomerase [Planctomycetota bacterium]MCX8039179.1 L-arabinose isomerase [Planctomycetota bacterium]MDW8373541.1 L-arabinose isomerase [Planctomycetota bacterium]